MDVAFTGITNVAHSNTAVFVNCGISAQYIFNGLGSITQNVLYRVQLAAVDGISRSVRDFARSNVFQLTFVVFRTKGYLVAWINTVAACKT